MISFATYGLYLAAALFCIGLVIILTKKNLIFILIGTELLLNATNLNLVIFSRTDSDLQGQMLALFIIVIAVAEASIALAILLNIFRKMQTSNLNDLTKLGN